VARDPEGGRAGTGAGDNRDNGYSDEVPQPIDAAP
jgi:hypothetical protein